MAAQFCVKCGSSLPADAQFCLKCGSPVAAAPAPAAAGPTLAPPPSLASPSPGGGPTSSDLSGALGLRGQRSFLVQHQVLSMGHSYRVMDSNKNHLFTVRGDAGQNIQGNMLGSLVGGGYLGRFAARSVTMSYTLVDPQGTVHGSVVKEGGGNSSTFTLTDSSGQPWVVISLSRGVMGGITATAADGQGRPLMSTGGNLMRHNFMIKDAAQKDLAKVHEAWVAVRDTYNVDMLGSIDPVYPLVFTIMLDFEKEK
ncbi:MAG TPA: zinc-ribbon domain-containing protein [Thermoplasmata archaeon]|nr:zinc-ribbon domain-containing protein [Thermoplasmata archaeon]